MPKVNILPPDVIAKIAAGEVVDRPASVIKELLENSIDAGAMAIEIHLKDAGKELIHIKDNGCGITRADIEKLFNRHATSKITAIDDLESLHSMGFRGEALYSIGAVSDVTLRSQTDKEAWEIHMRGGQRLDLAPASPSGQGTDIKVSELFFNTPARRKFLKSNTAELNQILNIVLPYTLIYPDKKFTLTHAGRSLLDLRSAPNRLDRAAAALNLNLKDLIETDQEFVQEAIRVRLILGNINVQRARRDLQYIFVNNRPVDSKNLSFNLNDVYKLIMPPGVYGAFILDITINPANVDVNIHPTKREVRIKDEAKLVSLIRRVVEYQLMQKGGAKTVSHSREGGNPDANMDPRLTHSEMTTGMTDGQGIASYDIIYAPGQLQSMMNPASYANRESTYTRNDSAANSLPVQDDMLAEFNLFNNTTPLRDKFAASRYIGQFMNKYLLFEANSTLMLVDQHAAQERIMFEKFKNQIEAGTVEVQPLLTPILLKLSPQERIAWEETQEKLHEVGIETNQFDDETIAIQTQPTLLKNIERTVRTLLAGDDTPRLDKDTLARRACKASITAGDKLAPEQVEHQRKQLLNCHDPFTCPHGRPTVIEITDGFLERQFLRT